MRDMIESLESRKLLAAGGPVVTDFKIAPRSPVETTRSVTFLVTYSDTQGVNALSFDNRDLRVTGPNGYVRYATVAGSASNANATVRTVRYKIPTRGLAWDSDDNGVYSVRLQGNQVFDILNNANDPRKLGSFTVNIPARGATPAGTEGSSTVGASASRPVDDLLG